MTPVSVPGNRLPVLHSPFLLLMADPMKYQAEVMIQPVVALGVDVSNVVCPGNSDVSGAADNPAVGN